MLFQPGADLVPAGAPGQIRNDICVWNTPIAGAEQAGGVVASIRNENDLCAGSGRQLPECAQKPSVDDIGQVPWIGRFGAIEDPSISRKITLIRDAVFAGKRRRPAIGSSAKWNGIVPPRFFGNQEPKHAHPVAYSHWLRRWSDRQVPSPRFIERAVRFYPHDLAGHRRLFRPTYLGQALGWYQAGEGAGLIGAVVGAIIVLVIWGLFATRQPTNVA